MASAKATAKKKTTRGKQSSSKSAAIRAYLEKNPDAGPTAVCAALKSKGIAITPAHVSNVRTALIKKTAVPAGGDVVLTNGTSHANPTRRGRKPSPRDSVSLTHLLEARKFAAQVGGVTRALELLQSLAKLQ